MRSHRLLACDGGGIRGLISIEVLAKLEKELRNITGKPKLVLADFFDYVGGTSCGAIIAALIAMGKPMDDVRTFFISSCPDPWIQKSATCRAAVFAAAKSYLVTSVTMPSYPEQA